MYLKYLLYYAKTYFWIFSCGISVEIIHIIYFFYSTNICFTVFFYSEISVLNTLLLKQVITNFSSTFTILLISLYSYSKPTHRLGPGCPDSTMAPCWLEGWDRMDSWESKENLTHTPSTENILVNFTMLSPCRMCGLEQHSSNWYRKCFSNNLSVKE